VWGGVLGISMALGPVVGGGLVSGVGWRSIFWVNLPIGAAAIVLTQIFVPESRAQRARRVDPAGQGLVLLMLGSLISAIIEGPDHGWGSPLIVALFAVAALAAVALIITESRRREPLIDLRFFRSAPFSGATVLAVSAFAVLGGFLFLNTLYLQSVRGYSAVHAGVLTLPMALMIGIFAPLSGRLVGTRGPRLPLVLAGLTMTAGALMLTSLTAHTPTLELIGAYVLLGVGFGLVNAPISNSAVSGMPRAQAGVAAAVASTSRQIGSSLGVAVTGSLVAAATGPGFAEASHTGWAVLAGCGVVVLVVGLLTTGAAAGRSAARVRELLDPEEVRGDLAFSTSH
jgi:MFS family permease